jgi:hypothetical protein
VGAGALVPVTELILRQSCLSRMDIWRNKYKSEEESGEKGKDEKEKLISLR